VPRSSLHNNKEALLNKLGLQRAKPKTGSPLTRTKLMNDYITQGQSRELLFLNINFPGELEKSSPSQVQSVKNDMFIPQLMGVDTVALDL